MPFVIKKVVEKFPVRETVSGWAFAIVFVLVIILSLDLFLKLLQPTTNEVNVDDSQPQFSLNLNLIVLCPTHGQIFGLLSGWRELGDFGLLSVFIIDQLRTHDVFDKCHIPKEERIVFVTFHDIKTRDELGVLKTLYFSTIELNGLQYQSISKNSLDGLI